MMSWSNRSHEEKVLLNPGFCASLLWLSAQAHNSFKGEPLALEESFLVLPLVLDRKTREALPRSTKTSMACWLDDNPLIRQQIATRANLLVTFTKEALMFGGIHGLISISNGQVLSSGTYRRAVDRTFRSSSDEVREIAKKANFVGKWFAHAGAVMTVFALLGVRP